MRKLLSFTFLCATCFASNAYCTGVEYGKMFASPKNVTRADKATPPAQPVESKRTAPATQRIPQEPAKQVIPSGKPATFEEQEVEAQQRAEYEQYKRQQALQAQIDAEKAKANQPTVIVVQQPQPELSLFNVVTSLPGMFIRSMFK